MRAISGAVAVLSAVILMAAPAAAQTATPAETPPSEFAGNQYVDSAGCVFMRGEIGNTVAWLPRLNRDRQQVCGYAPSFPVGAQPATTAEPVTGPDTAAMADLPESAVMPAAPADPARARPRTRSVATAVAETDLRFVQVGAFAVFSNADRMAERLLAMGLRVTIVRERLGHRPIRSVLAGPFDDEAAYHNAFLRLRQAGFADAFRRRQPVHMP
jgi:cell division septation protein DedD